MVSLHAACMSVALSLLSGLNSSSQSTNLFSIIYGYGTSQSSGVDPVTALQTAETNETKDVAAQAAQPSTARDIADFTKAVQSATSPQQLLSNPTVLKVLLTANGLGDQTSYTALATKALLSNTSQSGSLASQLSNQSWLTTAQTFDFANKGLSVIQNPQVLKDLTNSYAQAQWRASLDQTTPGLSNALDFTQRASTITSVDQILGDPTFRTVVTTALNIPEQIAFQPIEAQEKAISSKIDISKFKSPAFVEQMAKQYLVQNNLDNSSNSNTTSTSIASLAVSLTA